jgi:hypothetical protein
MYCPNPICMDKINPKFSSRLVIVMSFAVLQIFCGKPKCTGRIMDLSMHGFMGENAVYRKTFFSFPCIVTNVLPPSYWFSMLAIARSIGP